MDRPLPPRHRPGPKPDGTPPLTNAQRQKLHRERVARLLAQAGAFLREFPEGSRQRACGDEIAATLRHKRREAID